MVDRDASCFKCVVYEAVTFLAISSIVGSIIQFDNELYLESCRIAGYEIDMLVLDPIESTLPRTFA